MSVGDRLLKKRNEKGATQQEVADFVGVHSTTYQRWERGGNIPDKHKEALSAFFGVPPAFFLKGWEDGPKENEKEKGNIIDAMAFARAVEAQRNGWNDLDREVVASILESVAKGLRSGEKLSGKDDL